jgi:H+/Cl- antiporter ClcA
MVGDIAAWFRARLKIADVSALGFDVAALSSAFNGIIGNPVFTAVFASEYRVGGAGGLLYIGWNLLAGVIGFAVYQVLGLPSFAEYLAFPPVSSLEPSYFAWAIGLGVVGALLAVFAGLLMQGFGQLVPRLFHERVILRALAAGVVISLVGLVLPELMFSGEDQIHGIAADPASYGVGMLLLMAVLKLVLLGLSFKSGFLGGPTFPLLFAATMVALAIHLLVPDVPMSILVTCIEAPAIALALSAPLTAILLVAVIATADPDTLALVALATVVGLLVGAAVKEAMTQRARQHERAPVPAT